MAGAGRILRVALLAFAAACAGVAPAGAAGAGEVGYRRIVLPPVPAADGAPGIEVGLWYPAAGAPRDVPVGLIHQQVVPDAPAAGRALPLVVFSHGQGGQLGGHVDTALGLARAGFVVAALTHPGDNYRDQSRALDVYGRARQFDAVVARLAGGAVVPGLVDPARIGGFGFSAGALTVLLAAGGTPDLARIGPHCASDAAAFDCRLIRAHGGVGAVPRDAGPVASSPRLAALVLAAPALGFAFDRRGLAAVTQPVQLWEAEDDRVLPNATYAEIVRAALPRPPETRIVPGADHLDFLVPCSDALEAVAPAICADPPGFDRAAFHRAFDAAVVAFFARTLASRPG